MQLWPVAHFFHFVITFGWVQQQSNTKSDDKNGQEMFNWSEVHSEKKYYL